MHRTIRQASPAILRLSGTVWQMSSASVGRHTAGAGCDAYTVRSSAMAGAAPSAINLEPYICFSCHSEVMDVSRKCAPPPKSKTSRCSAPGKSLRVRPVVILSGGPNQYHIARFIYLFICLFLRRRRIKPGCTFPSGRTDIYRAASNNALNKKKEKERGSTKSSVSKWKTLVLPPPRGSTQDEGPYFWRARHQTRSTVPLTFR